MATTTGVALGGPPAAATPGQASSAATVAEVASDPSLVRADELLNPMEDKRRGLRQEALTQVLDGTATASRRGASTVVKVGKGAAANAEGGRKARAPKDRYVELSREKTDKIFVILAEFGDQRDPRYPDQDTNADIPGPTEFAGPLHNQIPKPSSGDNSTNWLPDFSRQHYQQLYFGEGKGGRDSTESLKSYYEKQSSGRYSVDGMVTDWVKVPYNEARYGRSDGYPCASNVCSNTWALVRDAVNVWVADQEKAGKTAEQIKTELASFDQWDRYDYDGDGNFNEPDGYIDHFQIVHAGGDQADGDSIHGEDAIWSHRWYAYGTDQGKTGPAFNELGGTQIGDTGLWVGDYTIQPENGGLSVFAHEYGHDLGLPDHYDTSGGDNGVEYWTLMAQSRLNAEGEPLGTRPGDLSAWDKLQLGWLDYEIVPAGTTRTLEIGPHEYNSRKPQGVVVPLPDKQVVDQLVPPASGAKSWWSGKGNELDTSLSREVALPADAPATLSFQANWDIEDCGPDPCDYAYVEVKDGAGDWTPIQTSIGHDQSEGYGIDGTSKGDWVAATADLSAYAGKTVGLRFHYVTDPAAGGIGFFADDVAVSAGDQTLFTDGAESGDGGWTADGFTAVGSSVTSAAANFYIASNRSYVSYDRYLETGPYNFGFLPDQPNRVEHFPYQPGLLVSYWDTSQVDNNTSEHPGEGLILPIDAHPRPIYRIDGKPWRSRVQVYDATFGLQRPDSFTLHWQGRPSYVRGQGAQPVFDDTRSYYDEAIPLTGVKVRDAGVRITVQQQRGTSMRIRIAPSPLKGRDVR
ncbi:MAG: immune inhibitor A domain-containing protein [Motilibacteraceae bacterium]